MARAGTAANARCLFLFTRSDEPCGVETFTRTLAGALASNDPGHELLSISGYWRDLPAIFRSVKRADQIVFSFPLVAWKRMLIIPLVVLLYSLAIRRRIRFGGSRSIRQFDWKSWTGADQAGRLCCSDAT